MTHLKTLLRLQEEREIHTAAILKKSEMTGCHRSSESSNDSGHDSLSSELDFDMADDILPEDDTAAATLHRERQRKSKKVDQAIDDDEQQQQVWLTKVAKLVNSKATKSKSRAKKQTLDSESCMKIDDKVENGDVSEFKNPIALSLIAKESRYGCKVVNTRDKVKIIGQVSFTNVDY